MSQALEQLQKLPKLEQIIWKLKALFGQEYKLAANFTEDLQSGFISLIDKIGFAAFKVFKAADISQYENAAIEKLKTYQEKIQEGAQDAAKYTDFTNWGDTVSTTYNNILYPTETAPELRQQIIQIQNFVRESRAKNLSIRGAGIRHSWANVFADPSQRLVSMYPYHVATGNSFDLNQYSRHCLLVQKKMEEISQATGKYFPFLEEITIKEKIDDASNPGKKVTLVKVGAGVSNDQLRRWCIKNKLQYKSNVIMVEVNVVGAIGTCSHGAGIGTQTVSDLVYAIEFIDHTGAIREISQKNNPTLIKSAASSLGLLGIIISVTLKLDDLQIIRFEPRQASKTELIPLPRAEFEATQPSAESREKWEGFYEAFKAAVHKTYSEWFYFPAENKTIFENCWSSQGKWTQQAQDAIQNTNGANFINPYPNPIVRILSQFSLVIGELANQPQFSHLISILLKNPFVFFPKANTYVNYPDGVHFQRGIQNMRVRDVEFEINVPSKIEGGQRVPDYDLIQRLWWAGFNIAQQHKDEINIALQMRIFKGSEATLAPQIGYEYVCSIEILRNMTLNSETEERWREVCLKVFRAWRDTLDHNGHPVIIRPHWGKEWDQFPEIKSHFFNDVGMKSYVRQFKKDYNAICQRFNIDPEANLAAFSNVLYRQLLQNAGE